MTGATINWKSIRLVVFDVDGTLYDQRALRLRMLKDLIGHTIASRSIETLKMLRFYRRMRETIGKQEIDEFDNVLIARTAEQTGIAPAKVRLLLSEWVEQRPLAHIRTCRYPRIAELFAQLKKRKKIIGIFSDYPAVEKLRALELKADIVVSASDVGILKPNPRGLSRVMTAAGVGPQETILIGDRIDRDGEAALRAGVTSMIRSNKPIEGWVCFASYAAPQFSSLLDA
jgi:HAD superfamily hydrolase (TIGR01549 family)